VEKQTVGRIAPHLAEPLPFIFPARRGTPWWRWKLRVGVALYDLLCGHRNFGPSEGLSRDGLLDLIPGLRAEGLTGGVRYFDAQTQDARLVIDTLRSAAQHGALVQNYCRAEAVRRSGQGWLCEVADTLDGRGHTLRSRCVVNAAGVWADRFAPSRVRLRPTKGVHLVVDRERLPVPGAVVMTEGKRLLFAIPWGERTILGTTDTDYDGRPEDVACRPEDAASVLGVVNRDFPDAALSAADVLSTWAGLRPLIATQGGRPSDISRAHQIHQTEPGWFDVAGGKLTTYRRMAEETVDAAGKRIGRAAAPCRTADAPLLAPEDARGISGILPPEVCPAVVHGACREEWAVHLDDLMVRRTSWHHYRTDRGAVAEHAAVWMGEALGWTAERQQEELGVYHKTL
jgi:glycerol-3-phosphate dehydrogenase